jgi:solute carrier family 12 (potassium/chloride transporter), member 4/6
MTMTWFKKYLPFFSRAKSIQEDPSRLGTFMGVFTPTLLMLFGVIIFLRLGWIVGLVGLPVSLFIITLSALIALLTLLSIAAISTNIDIGKGGFYYILSRSLGSELGCALGLPLFLKQSLSISFCIVGFSESLHDLMPSLSMTTLSICSLSILTLFALNSLKGALKLQIAISIVLLASFISFFTGGTLAPEDPETFIPAHSYNLGFWAIFAIFFPAMTGVESSVSLSGDLKDPSKSLPLGTISALLIAYLSYIAIAIFLIQHVPLDRLVSDPLVMQKLASVPSLIVLGIWGATLSSALGGILGAPRTLQAMAEDGVAPAIFSKTSGSGNEPKAAILLTFLIALAGVCFGSVNLIAQMLTMICLICYGVLNLSAGMEIFMENPSWRPRFRLHWFVPILGAILSFMTMLMINSGTAILSLGFVGMIYLIAKYRQLGSPWDDIRHGVLQFLSRFAIYRLAYAEVGLKSWRPHFLIFTEQPEVSSHVLSFSQAISKNKGFLTVASILPPSDTSKQQTQALEKSISRKLQAQNIQALVQISYATEKEQGMAKLIENYGLGPLTPNTIIFGGVSKGEAGGNFAKVIQLAYQQHCNIIIVSDNNVNTLENLFSAKAGNIHIWWDDINQANGEFMLVLSHMLQKNPLWKKAKICVKSFVTHEIHRQQKIIDFQVFAKKNRLHMEIEVLVCHNSIEEASVINMCSCEARIVFLGLRKLDINESAESYDSYLQSMSKLSSSLSQMVLVLSSEHNHLKGFFIHL